MPILADLGISADPLRGDSDDSKDIRLQCCRNKGIDAGRCQRRRSDRKLWRMSRRLYTKTAFEIQAMVSRALHAADSIRVGTRNRILGEEARSRYHFKRGRRRTSSAFYVRQCHAGSSYCRLSLTLLMYSLYRLPREPFAIHYFFFAFLGQCSVIRVFANLSQSA